MSDERNTHEGNKQKSFYSVNLTPTRTIIIFISAIAVLGLILIGTFVVFSQISKNKNTSTQSETNNTVNSDYSYNYDLTGETTPTSTITDSTSDKISSPLQDKKTTTETSVASTEPENEKSDMSVLEVDNSEVLYSSKFKEPDNSKSDTAKLKFTSEKKGSTKKRNR